VGFQPWRLEVDDNPNVTTQAEEQMAMEVKDWVTLASASIVAIGWFVTGYLNRVKDVAQKRLEYRLAALQAFLPVWFTIQKSSAPFSQPGFLEQLEDARSKFQLYGFAKEIEGMEAFIKTLERQDLSAANAALAILVPLVLRSVRKELRLGN
jgi:hypothetical protein